MSDSDKYSKTIKQRRTGKLQYLPSYYAKKLRDRLIEAGHDYSENTIRAVVQGSRSNATILAEALKYAEECRNIEAEAGRI
ncbi:MAG: hypothetical protein C0424_10560 [Sphingobacteriaceae bacterium]|nr:hypothetical protein [Sphingobacteriaceae bacterium]